MATGPTSGPGSAAYYRSRMRAIMREDARRATTTMDGSAPYGRATRSGKPKPPPSRTAKSPAGRGGRATGGPMTATDAMRAGRNRGKKSSGPAGRGKQVSGKTSGMGPKKVAPPRRTAGGTYR